MAIVRTEGPVKARHSLVDPDSCECLHHSIEDGVVPSGYRGEVGLAVAKDVG